MTQHNDPNPGTVAEHGGTPLEVRPVARPGARFILRLVGDLDVCTADGLLAELAGLNKALEDRVELDLSALTFLDVRGIRALVAASDLAVDRGGQLTLSGTSRFHQRLLRITGFDRCLVTV